MGLHLDERADGFALYIDGDLQFDTADEAIYHESLALPALSLTRPQQRENLRVLICGGGDGLALRECLRFPGVVHADLVDYDPEVVGLGRTRFAELNQHAFEDSRTHVHIADAWEFLTQPDPYDVIICDFTVPRRPEDTRIFTVEWYERIKSALSPDGMLALNAVSPQYTPEAFWCLRKTVRTAGLSVLPYRVCIPSFRAEGYGAWGFLLASPRPLRQNEFRTLHCPVLTRQTDLTRLWRGTRFSHAERHLETCVAAHRLGAEVLLPLMLNPGAVGGGIGAGEEAITEPYSLDPLLRSIPIAHPYHTREMVETLARQVVGAVRSLDISRLVEALLRRAARLPADLVEELYRLKEFLRDHLPVLETFSRWGYKLFATLVILMTLANAIAPDNAFAKGAAGIGHASMSRGYSGGGRSTGGSFGGQRGFGSSFGVGRQSSFGPFGSSSSIKSTGFRSARAGNGYAQGRTVDIYGNSYSQNTYVYYGGGNYGHSYGYYHGGGVRSGNTAPPTSQKALFVADEDMLVLENGDVIITLSDDAYLLVTGGTVALMSKSLPDPLVPLFADSKLFENIELQLKEQQAMAQNEVGVRRDWLSWVGWTSIMAPSVAGDKMEVRNLEDLSKRLDTALQRIGKVSKESAPPVTPAGSVELFAGGYLFADGRIAFHQPDGRWLYTDRQQIVSDQKGDKARPCPPELKAALKSILQKLSKELTADVTAGDNYLRELQRDMANLNKDLAEYQSYERSYGSSYEVDYGTSEMSVSQAISSTYADIGEVRAEYEKTMKERIKDATELQTVERIGLSNTSFVSPTVPADLVLQPSNPTGTSSFGTNLSTQFGYP